MSEVVCSWNGLWALGTRMPLPPLPTPLLEWFPSLYAICVIVFEISCSVAMFSLNLSSSHQLGNPTSQLLVSHLPYPSPPYTPHTINTSPPPSSTNWILSYYLERLLVYFCHFPHLSSAQNKFKTSSDVLAFLFTEFSDKFCSLFHQSWTCCSCCSLSWPSLQCWVSQGVTY